MRRSIRTTLLLSTMLGTAIVLVIAGLLLYVIVHAGLVTQFDRALVDRAKLLASAVEWEAGEIDIGFEDLDLQEFELSIQPSYLEIRYIDGPVVFRSPSLGDDHLYGIGAPVGSMAINWRTLPDGKPGRAIGFSFIPKIEEGDEDEQEDAGDVVADEGDEDEEDEEQPPMLVLVLARNVASVHATLDGLRVTLVSVGVITVLVSAGVLWLFVRRGLRPLDRLADRIGGLDAGNLAQRISLQRVPVELVPVVERLNDLLEKLQTAFERERRFSADVAHELRTPLAGLRSQIEVALSKPRQTDDYEDVLGQCLRITVQTQQMIEHLLTLTRLDAGQLDLKPESVSLSKLVGSAWSSLAEVADNRRLRVEWRLDDEAVLTTDATLLGLVARNILENAVVHANEGGTVSVETVAAPSQVEIRVTNSGSELSQEQAGRVFDRFWRGDEARAATGVHCGLGLALVARAVDALGGTVNVHSTIGEEFTITVSVASTTTTLR